MRNVYHSFLPLMRKLLTQMTAQLSGFHIHQQKFEQERLEINASSGLKNTSQDPLQEHSPASSGLNNTLTKIDSSIASSGSENTSIHTVQNNTPASSGFNNTSENVVPVDYQVIKNLVSNMLNQIELVVNQETVVVGEASVLKLEYDVDCKLLKNHDMTSSNVVTSCTEDITSNDETCSTSSISHTETDLSDNENLIKSCSGHVVFSKPTKLSLKVILPKLSAKTINYWK